MTVCIEQLAYGTVFTYKGNKYQKQAIGWHTLTAISLGHTVLYDTVPTRDMQCSQIYPELGGRVQTQIDMYMAHGTQVNVE